jgi:putative oxidoreductase
LIIVSPKKSFMKFIVLLGRILFSVQFISPFYKLVSGKLTGYAASAGVPYASIAVPLAGVIALLGGLFILLGFKAKLGGWLIVLFLLPVTFYMHAFWKAPDPANAQMMHFMSNMAVLGAALIIAYFGSGQLSLSHSKR